jgi:hypothetical protein
MIYPKTEYKKNLARRQAAGGVHAVHRRPMGNMTERRAELKKE